MECIQLLSKLPATKESFMIRVTTLALLMPLMVVLTGAKGEGCGGEYQSGDGSSAEWDVGTLPAASGPDLPMSCEWLESNNCWKQFVAEAAACTPESAGAFNQDRSECTFAGGAKMQLAGPISAPAKDSTLVVVADHRVLSADGKPCFTGKILGVGRTAYASRSGTIVAENKNLTQYRLICPDGKAYANDAAGTCADFGARYLKKEVPTYMLSCEGGTDCSVKLGGSPGERRVAACR
jgi:hypothetical protein